MTQSGNPTMSIGAAGGYARESSVPRGMFNIVKPPSGRWVTFEPNCAGSVVAVWMADGGLGGGLYRVPDPLAQSAFSENMKRWVGESEPQKQGIDVVCYLCERMIGANEDDRARQPFLARCC
jgi:hypothetical protein